MGKNEIHWAIFSGRCYLPFTTRSTKKHCIGDFLRKRGGYGFSYWERKGYTCAKVVVNKH